MKENILKVGLVQQSNTENIQHNKAKLEHNIRELAEKGAHLEYPVVPMQFVIVFLSNRGC